MTKRIVCWILILATAAALGGCSRNTSELKVAFVTDGSPLEDGGINKIIWDALLALKDGIGLEVAAAVPKNRAQATLLDEIKKLSNQGFNMFFLHGEVFAPVLQEAQILYKDCRFVALDFAPPTLGDSAVSVVFSAHEAGFMAGFATALRLESARVGAILGLDTPLYQQYSLGFQQGVLYANANYGTRVGMSAQDFKIAGTETSESLTQQLAAQLYDSGVDCVFIAAGPAGLGALTEAKLRRANGADIWAVGSEYNQFAGGTYDGGNSVIITSAVKRWGDAVIDLVDLAAKGRFPGRQAVHYNAKNEGVGIPSGERNLTVDMRETCTQVAEKLQKGDIKVAFEWYEGLIK